MKALVVALFMAASLGASAQTVTDEPAKKPAAKKADVKKAPPRKKEVVKKATPEVKVYRNSANPPILRDKDGNVIPTNPSAYDVSSAIGKKK